MSVDRLQRQPSGADIHGQHNARLRDRTGKKLDGPGLARGNGGDPTKAADAPRSFQSKEGTTTMMLRRFAALGALALAVGMPAAASAMPASPVLLAMASYAGEKAGEDAVAKVSLKKAHWKAHAAAHAKGDCKDCPDCADCADCADCKDCDEGKKSVASADDRAGICDPAKHVAKKRA